MAGDTTPSALKWSSQLKVTSPIRTPKLPGDKILLPQSALEQLLAAAPVVEVEEERANLSSRIAPTSAFDPFNPYTFSAEAQARAAAASSGSRARQPQLPHPLTFRITNTQNGRAVYAGIREFSAEEGEVSLSSFLRNALGLEEKSTHVCQDYADTADTDDDLFKSANVTVDVQQLPKGTYVRLRPLEAGYESEDWKALLERHLRENFTTLTIGEVLNIPRGRNRHFKFLVDKAAPEGNGICIVDTDLEVDMEPLNEEQARETLRRRSEKTSLETKKENSSLGGLISKGQEVNGRVGRGEYVDYELKDWNSSKEIQLQLEAADGADLDIFISPLTPYQRSRPRSDEHVFGDMSSKSSKDLKLQLSTPELIDAETLYISIHAFPAVGDSHTDAGDDADASIEYVLRVTDTFPDGLMDHSTSEDHDPEEIQCKNCHQWVPKRTLFLHENFCFRNNILCPKCKNVFQKSSSEWRNHWHCEQDESFGNDLSSKEKHDFVFHKSHLCPNCDYHASSLPALAHHRTTRCPAKLILCQFCHLVVPQQAETDPDMNDPEVLLSGLAPHEVVDGGRTTECHLCNKILRLREMKTHLRHHDLERLSRPPPAICKNENCGRTLKSSTNAHTSLGLCTICFGPLYTDAHDPEGKALKRRIERRYLSQMLTGCGKPWCRNEYCKTGHPRSSKSSSSSTSGLPISSKDILQIIRPLIDAIDVKRGGDNTASFYFCSDETSQQRRVVGEMISAEGLYDISWCLAALEATGGDLDKARDWLNGWAPKRNEIHTTT